MSAPRSLFRIRRWDLGDGDDVLDERERAYRCLNDVLPRSDDQGGVSEEEDGGRGRERVDGASATVESRAFRSDSHPASFDVPVTGTTAWLGPRDDEDPWFEDPDDKGEEPRPAPPRRTTAAVLGLLIEQRLLSDFSSVVNRALRPVAGASFTLSPRNPVIRLAWVLPLLGSIATFVALDAATARLRIDALTANVKLRLTPDAQGSLQPSISVSLDGRVSSEMTSVVPSPLHRIVDLILEAIVNSSGPLLNALGSSFGTRLTRLWNTGIGPAEPTAPFGVDVPTTGSTVTGVSGSYLYVESVLAPPPGYAVPMADVRAGGPGTILTDTNRLPSDDGRHYASLMSSENTLNVLLAAAYRRGEVRARLTSGPQEALRMLTRPLFTPVFSGAVDVTALAPPRLTLQRALPTAPAQHGLLQTDFALTVKSAKESWARLLFTATVPVRVVAGSALGSTTPKIDLRSVTMCPLDVLLDLAQTTSQVTRIQAVELVRQTILWPRWPPGTASAAPEVSAAFPTGTASCAGRPRFQGRPALPSLVTRRSGGRGGRPCKGGSTRVRLGACGVFGAQ
ncbi:hypothetical protein ACFYRC_34450 [Streptomyces sp. NPDC005279]|uniref:hypothetical protein n=1 Tax=Streptomyces sp. NPDC005279 TaxID=3364712 RepID=UPI0036C8ADDD